MATLNHVQELLNTGVGTEGSLLIPKKIHDVLIPEVLKALIPRQAAAQFIGPNMIPGSSYDFNLETENTLDVRSIAEGTEVWLDEPGYNDVNIKPLKYGVGIKITRELEEDSKFMLLERAAVLAGRRLAENENSLVVTALDGANTTVAGGMAITIDNITTAMFNLENADFAATDFIVGNEVAKDLRNIDTFVEANKFGTRETLATGNIGNIYGMTVHRVSSNAGITATNAYIIDAMEAYAIVEKRPITVEGFDMPTHDMRGTIVTQRIAVELLKSAAVSKITTT